MYDNMFILISNFLIFVGAAHGICMFYKQPGGLPSICVEGKHIDLTNGSKEHILSVINGFRIKVAKGEETGKDGEHLPKAYGMRQLHWDNQLTSLAEGSAKDCRSRPELCNATDVFANRDQCTVTVQLTQTGQLLIDNNQTTTDKVTFTVNNVTEEKVTYAIDSALNQMYRNKDWVTRSKIDKHQDSNPYLTMVYGWSTHVGCGMTAFFHADQGQEMNDVMLVCNFSHRPTEGQKIYETEPPHKERVKLGWSAKCGCEPGLFESEDCLCSGNVLSCLLDWSCQTDSQNMNATSNSNSSTIVPISTKMLLQAGNVNIISATDTISNVFNATATSISESNTDRPVSLLMNTMKNTILTNKTFDISNTDQTSKARSEASSKSTFKISATAAISNIFNATATSISELNADRPVSLLMNTMTSTNDISNTKQTSKARSEASSESTFKTSADDAILNIFNATAISITDLNTDRPVSLLMNTMTGTSFTSKTFDISNTDQTSNARSEISSENTFNPATKNLKTETIATPTPPKNDIFTNSNITTDSIIENNITIPTINTTAELVSQITSQKPDKVTNESIIHNITDLPTNVSTTESNINKITDPIINSNTENISSTFTKGASNNNITHITNVTNVSNLNAANQINNEITKLTTNFISIPINNASTKLIADSTTIKSNINISKDAIFDTTKGSTNYNKNNSNEFVTSDAFRRNITAVLAKEVITHIDNVSNVNTSIKIILTDTTTTNPISADTIKFNTSSIKPNTDVLTFVLKYVTDEFISNNSTELKTNYPREPVTDPIINLTNLNIDPIIKANEAPTANTNDTMVISNDRNQTTYFSTYSADNSVNMTTDQFTISTSNATKLTSQKPNKVTNESITINDITRLNIYNIADLPTNFTIIKPTVNKIINPITNNITGSINSTEKEFFYNNITPVTNLSNLNDVSQINNKNTFMLFSNITDTTTKFSTNLITLSIANYSTNRTADSTTIKSNTNINKDAVFDTTVDSTIYNRNESVTSETFACNIALKLAKEVITHIDNASNVNSSLKINLTDTTATNPTSVDTINFTTSSIKPNTDAIALGLKYITDEFISNNSTELKSNYPRELVTNPIINYTDLNNTTVKFIEATTVNENDTKIIPNDGKKTTYPRINTSNVTKLTANMFIVNSTVQQLKNIPSIRGIPKLPMSVLKNVLIRISPTLSQRLQLPIKTKSILSKLEPPLLKPLISQPSNESIKLPNQSLIPPLKPLIMAPAEIPTHLQWPPYVTSTSNRIMTDHKKDNRQRIASFSNSSSCEANCLSLWQALEKKIKLEMEVKKLTRFITTFENNVEPSQILASNPKQQVLIKPNFKPNSEPTTKRNARQHWKNHFKNNTGSIRNQFYSKKRKSRLNKTILKQHKQKNTETNYKSPEIIKHINTTKPSRFPATNTKPRTKPSKNKFKFTPLKQYKISKNNTSIRKQQATYIKPSKIPASIGSRTNPSGTKKFTISRKKLQFLKNVTKEVDKNTSTKKKMKPTMNVAHKIIKKDFKKNSIRSIKIPATTKNAVNKQNRTQTIKTKTNKLATLKSNTMLMIKLDTSTKSRKMATKYITTQTVTKTKKKLALKKTIRQNKKDVTHLKPPQKFDSVIKSTKHAHIRKQQATYIKTSKKPAAKSSTNPIATKNFTSSLKKLNVLKNYTKEIDKNTSVKKKIKPTMNVKHKTIKKDLKNSSPIRMLATNTKRSENSDKKQNWTQTNKPKTNKPKINKLLTLKRNTKLIGKLATSTESNMPALLKTTTAITTSISPGPLPDTPKMIGEQNRCSPNDPTCISINFDIPLLPLLHETSLKKQNEFEQSISNAHTIKPHYFDNKQVAFGIETNLNQISHEDLSNENQHDANENSLNTIEPFNNNFLKNDTAAYDMIYKNRQLTANKNEIPADNTHINTGYDVMRISNDINAEYDVDTKYKYSPTYTKASLTNQYELEHSILNAHTIRPRYFDNKQVTTKSPENALSEAEKSILTDLHNEENVTPQILLAKVLPKEISYLPQEEEKVSLDNNIFNKIFENVAEGYKYDYFDLMQNSILADLDSQENVTPERLLARKVLPKEISYLPQEENRLDKEFENIVEGYKNDYNPNLLQNSEMSNHRKDISKEPSVPTTEPYYDSKSDLEFIKQLEAAFKEYDNNIISEEQQVPSSKKKERIFGRVPRLFPAQRRNNDNAISEVSSIKTEYTNAKNIFEYSLEDGVITTKAPIPTQSQRSSALNDMQITENKQSEFGYHNKLIYYQNGATVVSQNDVQSISPIKARLPPKKDSFFRKEPRFTLTPLAKIKNNTTTIQTFDIIQLVHSTELKDDVMSNPLNYSDNDLNNYKNAASRNGRSSDDERINAEKRSDSFSKTNDINDKTNNHINSLMNAIQPKPKKSVFEYRINNKTDVNSNRRKWISLLSSSDDEDNDTKLRQLLDEIEKENIDKDLAPIKEPKEKKIYGYIFKTSV